ncbi:MAG: exodeoxyribonuclease large subunit, partial [Oscillospiraceae bacterium]|nr:exodeoxyribonuclease large subunit [Oscillospiraceae bacterium]
MDNFGFLSVSDVNLYLKQIVANDLNLHGIFIKGEISNFIDHAKLGHMYFTLKDEKCAIKAVLFKGNRWKLKFRPENGMKVVVFGSVNAFERDG